MSRVLKLSAGLSMKKVPIGTIADAIIAVQLPAGVPQVAFTRVMLPLEHPLERHPGPVEDIGGWHHGGINE
jgi:hypothetical protein